MTKSEILLWGALRNRKFDGLKFRRQHPVGRFVLDFYCPGHKLAVEVDGGVHLEQEQQQSDKVRDELLLELGIRTLRVTSDDVETRMELVLSAIENAVSESTSNRATIETNESETPLLHASGEGAGGEDWKVRHRRK